MIRCYVCQLERAPYRAALLLQRRAVEKLQRGPAAETLFLLEHPHVITLGKSAAEASLLRGRASYERSGIAVIETDRGGDATYHGPGQLVGYPILKLEPERRDVRKYAHSLEEVLIRTLADFGITARRHPEYRGVWIQERKIASLGLRISRWVTSHGFALNVNTDISYFSLIRPCGIEGCTMTSMQRELGRSLDMADVRMSVIKRFSEVLGREMITGDFPHEVQAVTT